MPSNCLRELNRLICLIMFSSNCLAWAKNMKIKSLNVGCGADPWGDVRVDVTFSFLTMSCKPTVLADAHFLPFKDGSFKSVKASHVLEHLKSPSKAIDEILRVSTCDVILSFPTEWDVLPLFIAPHRLSFKWAYQTRKNRLHLWIIKPEAVVSYLRVKGWDCTLEKVYPFSIFHFFEGGRKAKYFKWLTKHFRIPFEYSILAKKRSQLFCSDR